MKIMIIDASRHLALQTGYGQMSSAIFSGLKNLGHKVHWEDHSEPVDLVLWVRPPHYIKQPYFNPAERNVIFTMHEEDRFAGWKSDWPQLLNKCVAAIVPTDWCKQVFVNHGTTTPIYTCRIGVKTGVFKPKSERMFSVLMVHENLGSRNSREDWVSNFEMINYFKDRNDIRFTIKTWSSNYNEQHPNTTIYRFEFVPEDMAKLYRDHHLFIKNTKLEGWSIPLTEAMASGMDIAASDLPVLRENAIDYPISWFKFGKVGELTKIVDDKYKEWKIRRAMLDRYDWKQSVEQLENILIEINGGK